MKNFQRIALGLLVVGTAFAGSAFTNASKLAQGDVYGNTDTTNAYTKLTNPYSPLLCEKQATTACAYTVTEIGAPFVTGSDYTEAQLEAFRILGYVTRSTEKGLYDGI